MDLDAECELQGLTFRAARDAATPIALLVLSDLTKQWLQCIVGLPAGSNLLPDFDHFARSCVALPGITIVADTTLDKRFAASPLAEGKASIRFLATAPLVTTKGIALGLLCVLDTVPRVFEPLEVERLSLLAEIAAARIETFRAEAALADQTSQYSSAIELNPQISWIAGPDGGLIEAGTRWVDLTGMSREQTLGFGWAEAIHMDDRRHIMESWSHCLATGDPLSTEYRVLTKDNSYRWLRVLATAKRDRSGVIIRWYGVVEDIHDRKIATTLLQESERRLRFAIDVGRLGVWEYNVATCDISASDLCAQTFGLPRGQDLSHYEIVHAATHPDDRAILDQEREDVLATGREMDVEIRTLAANGCIRWVHLTGRLATDEDGKPVQVFGLSRDVTEHRQVEREREAANARMRHLANHDALTDLANRRLFEDRLAYAFAAANRHAQTALLCIDLDNFKAINDQLGHLAGDALLRQVASRLRACVRSSDTVARYGGDEFAVLQTNVRDQTDIDLLAKRTIASIAEPYELNSKLVILGCSIGISFAPDQASDPEQLKRNADTALYRAKAGGRGAYRIFEREMDSRIQAQEGLKVGLSSAMANNELHLHYQPIIDLATGRVLSFEALMRWNHPQRGSVGPSEFIPLAEENGWIRRFGRWALRQACRDAATWPDEIRVAVNLSVVQFNTPDLITDVADAMSEAGLDPHRLELEVTETLLLQTSSVVTDNFEALRNMGTRIVMDDFGTGYSALSYLRGFKFDKIKIDKSLIIGLPDSGGGDTIVKVILGLGDGLGIAITAEGVETEAQLAFLRREGCAQAQGFLFSPAVQGADIPALLARSPYSLVAQYPLSLKRGS